MAKKRTQLVLSQDIDKLGNSGDLIAVASGYARNYLIPRSLAYRVTPGVLKQVEIRRDNTLPDSNKLGEYKVDIILHSEVTATINLRVAPD